jgi:hypothetical protein
VLRFYIALSANPNSTPTRRMRSLCCARAATLFDHLVGASDESRWHVEAERLSNLEVDDEFELGGLHHWQIGRFGLSLLKIQFGALEGRGKQRAASPILRGSTFIAMMQAANFREGNNVIACGR